jgi:hypothetical protein
MLRFSARTLWGFFVTLWCSAPAMSQPANNTCSSAASFQIAAGVPVSGTAAGATPDGDSLCALEAAPDVYHRFTSERAGVHIFELCGGTNWDSVLALHTGCPATLSNQVACDDDGCGTLSGPSRLVVHLPANSTYIVRVAARDSNPTVPGNYALLVTQPAAPSGACCNAAGIAGCASTTQSDCISAAGTWLGDNSTCFPAVGTVRQYSGSVTGGGLIPNNNPTGASFPINVPESVIVSGVEVSISLSHSWIGDLTATLSHGGFTATLFSNVGGLGGPVGDGGDSSNLVGTYTFNDTTAGNLWAAAASVVDSGIVPNGAYRISDADNRIGRLNAASNFGGFAGLNSSGPWVLRVVDSRGGDFGAVSAWSLRLTEAGPNACPPLVTGGCCFGTSTCSVLPQTACSANGGSYRGDGSVCVNAPGNPITCCPANFNQNSGVTVQDIFDFLSAWNNGLPVADFNGIGGVTVQDIFDFLAAWNQGC